jgi:hypothetical protein
MVWKIYLIVTNCSFALLSIMFDQKLEVACSCASRIM